MSRFTAIFVAVSVNHHCVWHFWIIIERLLLEFGLLDHKFVLGDILMAVSDEIKAKILRYFHVEKWRVGTISRQLNIHYTVVQRILLQSGSAEANSILRPSCLDQFLPFILNTLKKYPKLTASRLYQMSRIF